MSVNSAAIEQEQTENKVIVELIVVRLEIIDICLTYVLVRNLKVKDMIQIVLKLV